MSHPVPVGSPRKFCGDHSLRKRNACQRASHGLDYQIIRELGTIGAVVFQARGPPPEAEPRPGCTRFLGVPDWTCPLKHEWRTDSRKLWVFLFGCNSTHGARRFHGSRELAGAGRLWNAAGLVGNGLAIDDHPDVQKNVLRRVGKASRGQKRKGSTKVANLGRERRRKMRFGYSERERKSLTSPRSWGSVAAAFIVPSQTLRQRELLRGTADE
jgi:hypothetical protein